MEPCDWDLHLKNVFPKKFKYIILKKRKIDSQNFDCELRIALNDNDDVREWFKHFKENTNTEWILRQSTTCEESILNQHYVCQNSSYGKKRKYDDDEGCKSDFICKAAITVKIKKGGKKTYYQDEFVKRGYKGIMRICFIHSHLIDKAEVLSMARQSEETKKAFIGYFTEGMSPNEAIKNHEEILLLEGHEDLGNSRKNPPEHWVYSLYDEWTKQIENRLQLESQLTRASVFWKLQNQSAQTSNNTKSKNIVKLCKVIEDTNGMQVPIDLHVSDVDDDDNDVDDDSDSENQYDSYDEDSTPQVSTSYVSVSTTAHQSTVSSAPLKLNVPNSINIPRGCTLQVLKNNGRCNKKPSSNVLPLFVRIGKGANTSQGNSVQIITTSHENNKSSVFKFLTASANSRKYADLEPETLHAVNNSQVNLRSGKCTHFLNNSKEHQNVLESLPKCGNITKLNPEQFIKNSSENYFKGNENNPKFGTNTKPVFVRINKDGINNAASSTIKSRQVQKEAETVLQQILTQFQTSDDKDDRISNSKNEQTFQRNETSYMSAVSDESLVKDDISKSKNEQTFQRNKTSYGAAVSDRSIIKDNIIPNSENEQTFQRNKESNGSSISDESMIDGSISNKKSEQTFQRNKASNRSAASDERVKPILKKCIQNFMHSPPSGNLLVTGDVLKDMLNKGPKDKQNCPKQVSEKLSDSTVQQARVQKIITITKVCVRPRSANPSINEKKDKNDQCKDKKSNRFVNSKILCHDCDQQSKNNEKIDDTNQITTRSTNDSFDNCHVSNLVPKSYCDVTQVCSSSSSESVSQVFNQSSSVQSIKNPISSVVEGLGLPVFNKSDSIHKLPKHDTEITSALYQENLLSKVNRESTFQNAGIQGCPFPLQEDFYDALRTENCQPYLGSQNSVESQMCHLPFSEDLYNNVNNSQVLDNQNQIDNHKYSLLLSEPFCKSSDPPNITEDSGNHSISSDASFSLHDSDFGDSCNDMNSSQLPTDLDMSDEDSFQRIFPELSKLESELNFPNSEFSIIPSSQRVDLYSNHASVGSLINTFSSSFPELQVNPSSLFQSYEDNLLPIPENLKGNIEDIHILKNILNIKCNKLENNIEEDILQQPENFSHKDILEKWDSEMCRLRSLLEQNIHDQKLMREANQFLERIKERVVSPSELAVFFSSACNVKNEEKKY